MHPCLYLSELLQLIFDEVGCKATCARLARVCSTFTEPALDALYTNVDGFYELLTCLPSDLWALSPPRPTSPYDHAIKSHKDQVLTFKRDMNRDDWDILLSRTTRVRRLRQPRAHRIEAASDVHLALQACPVPPLFPRLRSLAIEAERPPPELSLFLGPELRHLEVAWSAAVLLEKIPLLPTICPMIDSLSTGQSDSGSPPPSPRPPNPPDLSELYRLRTLSIGPRDQDLLPHLASLPSLRNLTVEVSERTPWLGANESYGIRSLDSLHISADTFSTSAKALDALLSCASPAEPAAIHSLTITGESPSLADLVSTICARLSHTHLSALSISNTWRSTENPPDEAADLLPLSLFARLTRFTYTNHPRPVPMSGAQLAHLASSWPLLERLAIVPGQQPAMTGAELSGLSSACPRLKAVDLSVGEDNAVSASASASASSAALSSAGVAPESRPRDYALLTDWLCVWSSVMMADAPFVGERETPVVVVTSEP
ncbi:hypothetical protein CONPUDRAFT_140600 [Coniophora puteana RWD-64-598 SS2]|uniref:F-box domain-containing protein n=1 Tax=Coniophora puteana (strain RWD-64-598) TaxID=741705 RepID=R7SEH7_CONPW|nr:uncharacterized protein CONPUDRAFT_140600 [Coniophora puteana RWD-64-598 SS2]EIW74245.1 hypothetical protein CONPUDRAFT_140600 [Coniophora puteana RWD-64-598 SS2]